MYKNHYTESYALVIGINNYSDSRISPLSAAENDARQIAEVLSAAPYEFDVTLLLGKQATRFAITTALEDLYRVDPDARIIFYFAGHGYGRKDRYNSETGYLQVYDSLKGRDLTALRMTDVTELGRRSDAKHIAFIVDACSSALVLTASRGDEEVPAEKLIVTEARQVLSAAVDKAADHPSMTTFLLYALKNDSVNPKTGLYIFNDLGHDVLNDIIASPNPEHRLQTPVYGHLRTGSNCGGQFIFRQKKGIILDTNLRMLLASLHSPFERTSQGAFHDLLTELDHPENGRSTYKTLEALLGNEDYPRIAEVLEAYHQRQIERARAEIEQLIEEENWQAAYDALVEFELLYPDHPEVQRLGQAIEAGKQADRERAEYEQYIQSLVDEIEQRIQAGHFNKAREYLGELESTAPNYPDLSNLVWRIDQREIEIKIPQAQYHMDDGDLPAVERVIERIYELDPNHHRREVRVLKDKFDKWQYNISSLVSETEGQITDGNWIGARQKLDQLKQIAPNHSHLGEFERAIESGEHAEQERLEQEQIQRDQQLDSLAEQIEKSIQAGHYNKARATLDELTKISPETEHPYLLELERRIDAREIEIKTQQAQRYLDNGDFLAAERAIERIVEINPDTSAAHTLRTAIESWRRKQQETQAKIRAAEKAWRGRKAQERRKKLIRITIGVIISIVIIMGILSINPKRDPEPTLATDTPEKETLQATSTTEAPIPTDKPTTAATFTSIPSTATSTNTLVPTDIPSLTPIPSTNTPFIPPITNTSLPTNTPESTCPVELNEFGNCGIWIYTGEGPRPDCQNFCNQIYGSVDVAYGSTNGAPYCYCGWLKVE